MGCFTPRCWVDFEQPYAIGIAPEPGGDSSIISCEIADHTPGGLAAHHRRSVAEVAERFDECHVRVVDRPVDDRHRFTGIPSDLLSGFLNNSFLAFQMIQLYDRPTMSAPTTRISNGSTRTASALYNIETMFAFLNAIFRPQGYTQCPNHLPQRPNTLGRDHFSRAACSPLVYFCAHENGHRLQIET